MTTVLMSFVQVRMVIQLNIKVMIQRVMTKNKDIRKSNGFFGIGGKSEITTYEQYTMDGAR